jgi:hypothetical protein
VSILATQTAIGDPGSKATSELALDFSSLARVANFYYGANSSGLFLIDSGDKDLAEDIVSTVTFATTDFGFRNPKSIRFLYIGLEGSCEQCISICTQADGSVNSTESYTLQHGGAQRIRVPISLCLNGRYWRISISSAESLRIDSVEAQLILRSSGIQGY